MTDELTEPAHHTSPLGQWVHARLRPARLAGLVDEIWYFEGALAIPRERVFADGRYELVVQLGPRYRLVDARGSTDFPTCCLGGLRLGPEVIEAPPGHLAVLGVKLTPPGALALLRAPLHETAGITVALDDVVAGASAELHDRCASAAGARQRLHAASAWLHGRMAGATLPEPAVAWAAAEIERRNGAVSITALRDRTGWSRTRFTERFREQVGVTPKVLARMHRFRNALARITDQGNSSLTDIALAAGYYDQAHFSNEFRLFSGYTPAAFLRALRFPNSVSLAEER